MDELDFNTFFTLDIIVKKKLHTFLNANNLPDYKTLTYLITVNYLHISRGHCYEYDVGYINKSKDDKVNIRSASIMLTRLKKLGLVSYTRLKPGDKTIRNYTLTSNGLLVLDHYRSFFYRIENELTYDLKKERSKNKKSK